MKRHKGMLLLLAVSVLALVMVLTAFDKKEAFWLNANNSVTGIAGGRLIKAAALEPETFEEIKQSYIERYGLTKVDKPKRRTPEQVIERIAELAKEYELVNEIYQEVELYSEALLDHLANNPEMAAFVLGSLTANGKVEGGFTEEELAEDFPLLLQFDPRWGYFEYGGKEMGISGCGPTCLAMTILALTDCETMTPAKIADYSLKNDYYVQDVGTAWKLMDELPELYGLEVSHPTLKEASMKAELDKGRVLICSVRRGVFTAEGHFIVIYGYDETGFKVNDPKCVARSNQTWEFSEFGNQLKRIWAIGK